VPTEPSACGMPVSFQVERLKRDLREHLDNAASVLEVDLYTLEDADRDAALDAIVAGKPSPYVLVDGLLVCVGVIDSAAVLSSLGVEAGI
jgi:hypothetical protein